MTDLHNHTKYSPDSTAEPRDMIEKALSCGMEYYGISEHLDLEYVPHPYERIHEVGPETDVASYLEELTALKAEYAGRIKILFGMEFGYNPLSDMEKFRTVEKKYRLDYVINSIHVANGIECYWGENLEKLTQREAYESYLGAVRESLSAPYRYEIVGHIGYICRNAPYPEPYLHPRDYADLVDEILKEIVARDATMELNTSSRSAGSMFLPNPEILKRYRELGGENLSFGSDSHDPARIGDRYAIVKEAAEKLGFRYFDIYEDRKRTKVKI